MKNKYQRFKKKQQHKTSSQNENGSSQLFTQENKNTDPESDRNNTHFGAEK